MSLREEDAAAAANATAPRVTLDDLNAKIAEGITSFIIRGTLTICVIELPSGFILTGESACASPENFDRELGERFARENAINKLWQLEGYVLAEALHASRQSASDAVEGVPLVYLDASDVDQVLSRLDVEDISDLSHDELKACLGVLAAARERSLGQQHPAFVIGEGTPTSDA